MADFADVTYIYWFTLLYYTLLCNTTVFALLSVTYVFVQCCWSQSLRLAYSATLNTFATGPIPASIGNMTALEVLYLECNKLSGKPNQLASKKSAGSTSAAICVAGRQTVSTGQNHSICSILTLSWSILRLHALAGQIPDSIGYMSSLNKLSLFRNKLTGMLSVKILTACWQIWSLGQRTVVI